MAVLRIGDDEPPVPQPAFPLRAHGTRLACIGDDQDDDHDDPAQQGACCAHIKREARR